MKRVLATLAAVLALSAALAFGNPHPSVALRVGYAGSADFGFEVSTNCQLFQPPVGTLKPTIDLSYHYPFTSASFGMRYLLAVPPLEGIRAGGGAGIGYADGFYGYVRADAEFDLDVGTLPLPVFLGVDAGYAVKFQEDAYGGFFAALKLGVRF